MRPARTCAGPLKELTESSGDLRLDDGREVELKGISGRQCVYEVGWR